MNQNQALVRLEWSVRALAQPANEQRALFPEFVCVADELALELEESLHLVKSTAIELPRERAEAITRLDAQLEAMSGPSNMHFWTDEALDSASEWASVRGAARDVIRAFGWSGQPPSGSPQTYVAQGLVVCKSDAD